MAAPETAVNLSAKFALFEDRWSPKIVGQVNDMHVKAVKVEGEFVWHSHADTDELFLVHRGRLAIDLPKGRRIELGPGEFFVVPRGLEHRPVAEEACEILLLEPAGVVNTGDAVDTDLTAEDEWI